MCEMPKSGQDWSRRDLGRAVVGGAVVAGLGGMSHGEALAGSLLDEFRQSLRPDQRQDLILAGDDPRRSMVQNNWAVVPATIADLTATQQKLAIGLVRQVCTPEGFARLSRAREDDSGGWMHDHIALFESANKPERIGWVITGRHLTLHGNGAGAITAGPLFLGHSVTGSGNIWREPMSLVSELVGSFNDPDRNRAFGASGLELIGSRLDQRELIRRLLLHLTGSFREFAVPSVQACLAAPSRLDGVIWQGFSAGGDKDQMVAWRLFGPGWRWSFHVDPHPHAWFDAV